MTAVSINDTIAAPATPAGHGAIAVVRLSGPQARRIAAGLLGGRTLPTAGRLAPRVLLAPDSGRPLDEALVVHGKGPNTYTGEDLVEFHVHGSPVVVEMLLRSLVFLGARLAKPGEFTLRAFLNDKKDLTQAEAVHDLISAASPAGATEAAAQVLGGVSRAVESLAARLLSVAAALEAELDFPDDVEPMPAGEISGELDDLRKELEILERSYESGRLRREGFRVVIAGPPNVGKSSLFNALLGHRRAIVSDEAGTTRDYLEEFLPAATAPVLLVDTAGLREARSAAERAGVELTGDLTGRADLILQLFEAPGGKTVPEPAGTAAGRPTLRIQTKCDLRPFRKTPATGTIFPISNVSGSGLEELRAEIIRRATSRLGEHDFPVLLTNRRHRDCVSQARMVLDDAVAAMHGLPRDVLASAVRGSLAHLNEITGKGPVTTQVLNEIFARFCIGK